MNNIFHITGDLKTVKLKFYVPQVGCDKFNFIFNNNVFEFMNKNIIDHKIDFVVNNNYEILLGIGHFKLNNKESDLKMAGTVIINEIGRITYMDNDSGHYEPNKLLFNIFVKKLKLAFNYDFKTKIVSFQN